jgi:hypothetical protein
MSVMMLMISLRTHEPRQVCPSSLKSAKERLVEHPSFLGAYRSQRKAEVQETPEQKVKREKKESEEAAILEQGKVLWEVVHAFCALHLP